MVPLSPGPSPAPWADCTPSAIPRPIRPPCSQCHPQTPGVTPTLSSALQVTLFPAQSPDSRGDPVPVQSPVLWGDSHPQPCGVTLTHPLMHSGLEVTPALQSLGLRAGPGVPPRAGGTPPMSPWATKGCRARPCSSVPRHQARTQQQGLLYSAWVWFLSFSSFLF